MKEEVAMGAESLPCFQVQWQGVSYGGLERLAQWLKALALAEDLGSISNNNVIAHNYV